jgi:hypothetical protein
MSDNAVGYFEDDPDLLKPTGLGAPKSKRTALELIDQFAKRSVQGMWPHMGRSSFIEDLKDRILSPDQVDQRTTALCGVVAMVRS